MNDWSGSGPVPVCQVMLELSGNAATGVPSASVVPPVPKLPKAAPLLPTASAGRVQVAPDAGAVRVYIRPLDQNPGDVVCAPPNTTRRPPDGPAMTIGDVSTFVHGLGRIVLCDAVLPLGRMAV